MSITKKEISLGLFELGLVNGAAVIVHSSYKSFGGVEGGPEAVIDAILDVIGSEGTLAVPALTGKATDSPLNPPVFDVRHTPTWTGIIPETVRRKSDSVRSLHPTHSVAAIGKKKYLLTSEHHLGSSPCDKYSPYYKLSKENGYILLIGVGQNSNTTVHCCEELAGVPYHLQKEATISTLIDYTGNTISINNYLHDWEKPKTDFRHLDPILIREGILRRIEIGMSEVSLLKAHEMIGVTRKILKKEPYFLVV